jgi:hypothetical protein
MGVKDFLFTDNHPAPEIIVETKACLFLRKLYDDFYQQTS